MSDKRLTPDRSLEGRRILDTAVGILVGLRRCGIDAAFQELITAAQRHEIPVFAIASALVARASGQGERPAYDPAADLAADREWGHLLGQAQQAHVAPGV
jgi:ANTAR domain